ncbi:MAG: 2-oxo acid dehydrogenase subunit E2 [Verrucomicrobiota bacterium]
MMFPMNIDVGPPDHLTSYRKIAIASWRHPRDPTTYSWMDFPVDKVEEFLAARSDDTAATMTHFVALALADCFRKQPEFDRLISFGRIYPRKSTDAFITTLLRDKKGKDLTGFVLRDINKMSLEEVAAQSARETEKLRKGEDKEMESVKKKVGFLPAAVLRIVFAIQEFVAYTLNWDPRILGMPKDRFGSFMISNIGALGLERGLIPLSPYSRCPVIIGLGKPREAPVVRDGEVVVTKVMTVSMTFDHRIADGIQGAFVLRRLEKIFARPEGFPEVFASKEEGGDD